MDKESKIHHKPSIMGILNVTPDSFSDGGHYLSNEIAIEHGLKLIEDGADILDIGAESTRPNSKEISSKDELKRISNTVSELSKKIIVSVDTFREETALSCLESGAKIINDVSALRFSKNLGKIIAEHKAEVVLMYSKQEGNHPHATTEAKEYQDIISEIIKFLDKRIEFALSQGIEHSKIILDPGLGTFISPNPKYSWEVIERLEEITQHFKAFRVLVGCSRKGFLGYELEDRDPISQFTGLISASKGAKIIRTHNVKMMKEFCTALD